MKQLLLIRHAKSSWKDPSISDLARPLKKRGIEEAAEMGQRLGRLQLHIDRVLVSPARRAIETIECLGNAAGFSAESTEVVSDLYSFQYDDLMLYLKKLPEAWRGVALVGHNPALTDLVNFLTSEDIYGLPTCGVAFLELDVDRWSQIHASCGRLHHYDYPKSSGSIDVLN